MAAVTRGQISEPSLTIVSSTVPPSGAKGLAIIASAPAAHKAIACAATSSTVPAKAKGVDVAVGNQRQQPQIWRHSSGVRRACYARDGLCGKRQPLRRGGPRPQPSRAEISSDGRTNRVAFHPPIRGDASVEAGSDPDRLRIATRL